MKKCWIVLLLFSFTAVASQDDKFSLEDEVRKFKLNCTQEELQVFRDTISQLSATLLREKKADEIIAQYQDRVEFMSCADWIRKEHPAFQADAYKNHPLFPLLNETMQLADFEVDVLEGFLHTYMETDMGKEQGLSFITLCMNSVAAKNLVADFIGLLKEEHPAEKIIETHLQDRFVGILRYQNELTTETEIQGKKCKRERISTSPFPTYKETHDSFLRSYNTKLHVIRSLLYHLRQEYGGQPLIELLPAKIIGLLRLSPSIFPYFNNEDDNWVDYDIALAKGEVRNFIGNAPELKINLRELFKQDPIKLPKVRAAFKKLADTQLPSFLLEDLRPKVTANKTRVKNNNKTKCRPPLSQQVTEKSPDAKFAENIKESRVSLGKEEIILEGPKQSPEQQVSSAQLKVIQEKSVAIAPIVKPEPTKPPEILEHPKVSSRHQKTIYDIFSPQGYKKLNSDKIITAWEHVLNGRGYHKSNTGRSHQPLYANLIEGSQVVLGLFRSDCYGPRYVKYIREAFDKIGFGRNWLENQGYRLG